MTAPRDRKEAAGNIPGGPYNIIQAMIGHEPNRSIRSRIEAVRSALDARDDDAIWVVLGIFESALDRGERVYRSYVRGLIVATLLLLAVSGTNLYVMDERLRLDSAAMRADVTEEVHRGQCGGLSEQDACDVARWNAATPARRAVSSAISHLPDELIGRLALFPNLDAWLSWLASSEPQHLSRCAGDDKSNGPHHAQ